jgi:hypothetical protein
MTVLNGFGWRSVVWCALRVESHLRADHPIFLSRPRHQPYSARDEHPDSDMQAILSRAVLRGCKRPEFPSGELSTLGVMIPSWCMQRMWVQGGAFAGGGR